MSIESTKVPTAKNALVFMTNETFSNGFLVTLASALISSDLKDFNIYVGYAKDDPIDRTWPAVIRLCKRFKFPVERCQRIEVDLGMFEGCEIFRNGTYHAYGRIYLANVLKEPTLFYLDSDMIVLDDLSKLVELAPQKLAIAAVQDMSMPTHLCEPYEFVDPNDTKDASSYFNSGLLLINKSQYDKADVLNQLNQLYPRVKNVGYWDQTYLNIIFKNKWEPLPKHWNSFTHPICPCPMILEGERTAIIHFAGPEKPWDRARMNVPNILWFSIAQSIGVQLAPEFLDEYNHLAKHFELNQFIEVRKETIGQVIDFFTPMEHYRKALLQNLENYGTELSIIQSWLTQNGLDPISEPFTKLLHLIK